MKTPTDAVGHRPLRRYRLLSYGGGAGERRQFGPKEVSTVPKKKKSPEVPLSIQRAWTNVVLGAGIAGLLVSIALKLGHATSQPGILLSLSLGLICLALGLGFRLEHRERVVPRIGSARAGIAVDALLLASAFLLIGASALMSLS